MNQFNTWWDSLDGESDIRKASTYTEDNSDGRGQTSMPYPFIHAFF